MWYSLLTNSPHHNLYLQIRNLFIIFTQTGHFLNRFKHVDDKAGIVDAIQKQFLHNRK